MEELQHNIVGYASTPHVIQIFSRCCAAKEAEVFLLLQFQYWLVSVLSDDTIVSMTTAEFEAVQIALVIARPRTVPATAAVARPYLVEPSNTTTAIHDYITTSPRMVWKSRYR